MLMVLLSDTLEIFHTYIANIRPMLLTHSVRLELEQSHSSEVQTDEMPPGGLYIIYYN